MPRPVPLLVVALAGAIAAAPAQGAAPAVWATVNICDTPRAPNKMGVRASMAGIGKLRRMYVRFRAQYIRPDGSRWEAVGGGVSPWLYLGKSRRRRLQAGWTFTFAPPPPNGAFRARGIAEFQWRVRRRRAASRRARWVISRRRRAVTRGGIRGVDAGDPPRTSLASCLIS
jgi:hypothetical protein